MASHQYKCRWGHCSVWPSHDKCKAVREGKKEKKKKDKTKKKNGGSRIAILWTRGENAVLITAICPGYLTWTNWVLNSTSYIQGYNSEKLRPGLSLRLRQYIPLIAFVDTGLSVSFSPSSLNTLLGGGGSKKSVRPSFCCRFILIGHQLPTVRCWCCCWCWNRIMWCHPRSCQLDNFSSSVKDMTSESSSSCSLSSLFSLSCCKPTRKERPAAYHLSINTKLRI